jgi:hypothetical protein
MLKGVSPYRTSCKTSTGSAVALHPRRSSALGDVQSKKDSAMKKIVVTFALGIGVSVIGAEAQQYPMIDMVANKIVQKYQTSSCDQLWQERSQGRGSQPKSPHEQQAIQMLQSNPQMRTEFINKVAAPIANKMFECGMIP